jgi:hypothetical protein
MSLALGRTVGLGYCDLAERDVAPYLRYQALR